MSKTPSPLRHAKTEYAALHYAGDLAADVRNRTTAKPRRLHPVAWGVAACAAIAGGLLFLTISRTEPIQPPTTPAQPTTIWSVSASCAIPPIQNLPALPSIEWSLPPNIPFPAMSVPWPSGFDSTTPQEKSS